MISRYLTPAFNEWPHDLRLHLSVRLMMRFPLHLQYPRFRFYNYRIDLAAAASAYDAHKPMP